ncbi:hypothetical protein [Pseudoalteromonas sp. MMG012]|uniref:hypothetical protein n=1 Tax=Pseudoalteromonas sp. MMG012 TaxID=2822686 RepID=UPI001B39D1E8|nr:hypothetical protein [Pseudoalteromonas sp. MMG012]MBQ4848753.1 hypothetical protein [Pseudoalteromonas sp. MMG012]
MKKSIVLFALGITSLNALAVDTSTISITDAPFSAIANDIIDDSHAIQSATNFAIQNNKSVYIPAGTFNIESTLDFTM